MDSNEILVELYNKEAETLGLINKSIDIPDAATSGYTEQIDSPETLAAVEEAIKSNIEFNSIPNLNRAQRRFLAKKAGKTGRAQMETISEAAKKLTYVRLIEGLRKLNEIKEKENEDSIKDH